MATPDPEPTRVDLGAGDSVSALWLRPPDASCALAFAHGAGAGMQHAFMEAMAGRLADRGVATLRYQFPYMEQGSRRPDRRPRLVAAVRAAVAQTVALADGLPVLAGGKSMGGRMTSLAASESALPGVAGIVFFGFPLHPAGKPSRDRAEHLRDVDAPMLFLQGTRDKLAGLDLLGPVVEGLGAAATLHVAEGADHSFHVLKRSGRTDDEVLDELADATAGWGRRLPGA